MVTRRGVIHLTPEKLDSGETSHRFRVEEAFGNFPPGISEKLSCKPTDTEFAAIGHDPSPNAVLKAGEKLFNVLNTSRDVQMLFAQMAAGTATSPETYPLFVKIEDPPGPEELPWEVLWEQDRDFLALDPQGRWPIARLVASLDRPVRVVKSIDPVLRITLVLAAADVSGGNEWDSFKLAAGVLNVPIEVLVLVSEEQAVEQVRNDLAMMDVTQIRGNVEYVGDQESLVARIVESSPNIVHFFCHGKIDAVAQLDLETRVGRISGSSNKGGSIILRAQDLKPIVALRSLWLIVLNCCSSGKSTSILHSIAKSLVAGALPAVVAMREPVEVDDANIFTRHFYASLFRELNPVIGLFASSVSPKDAPLAELLWMRATDAARRELSKVFRRVAANDCQWTYPVLYLYRGEVCVEKQDSSAPKDSMEERVENAALLRTLNLFLDGMRSGIDPVMDEKRSELAAAIHTIEERLKD
jgi:CHAT domain